MRLFSLYRVLWLALILNFQKPAVDALIHSWGKAIQTYLSVMVSPTRHHKLFEPLKNNKLSMLQEEPVPFIGIASFKMTGDLKRPEILSCTSL